MRISPTHEISSFDLQNRINCKEHLKKTPHLDFSPSTKNRQQNGNNSKQSQPPTIEVTKPSDRNSNKPRNGKSKENGHSRSKSAQTHAESLNTSRQRHSNYPMDVLQLQMDGSLTGRPMNFGESKVKFKKKIKISHPKAGIAQPKHSPSMKSNITVPKRRYSTWRKDSLIEMDTPEFTEVRICSK